ncbi:amino acid adenylation domain-containing protein [Kordia sp.]|uniref:amino acid adenylation domain-containing protein n=1 Tax=Kordia sp. TaxID=1965332 RepID=UPI003D2D9D09
MESLLKRILENKLLLKLEDGKLKMYAKDKNPIDTELIKEIKARKTELENYLLAQDKNTVSNTFMAEIPTLEPQESYELSSSQLRLWILNHFEEGAMAYNIPSDLVLQGTYNFENFKKAIHAVVERHEILRTIFRKNEEGEPRQWIIPAENATIDIDFIDVSDKKDYNTWIDNYIAEDNTIAFDLEKGPLFRVRLLKLTEEKYLLYYNMHHIIGDAWSMEVLFKEIFEFYNAYENGTGTNLPELRIQYKDFSAWQQGQIKSGAYKPHQEFWKQKFEGDLPLLDLPSQKIRPKNKTFNGHKLGAYLSPEITKKLQNYCTENGGSLYIGLLAAWNAVFHRYSGQTEIVVGTPVAGRGHVDLDHQIGFYVNTLPLKNEINAKENFDTLFQHVKLNTLESYNHQQYPFDLLVEDINLVRDPSRSSVFDVIIGFPDADKKAEDYYVSTSKINQIQDYGNIISKVDLAIIYSWIGNSLFCDVIFNTDVYERSMIEKLITHFKQFIVSILDNSKENIETIDFMAVAEKEALLSHYQGNTSKETSNTTILDLFEAQVDANPNTIAHVFGATEYTYAALSDKATRLGQYLKENYEVGANDMVGVMMDTNEWSMICMLGILKSGAGYVFIDNELPEDRKGYIIQNAAIKALIIMSDDLFEVTSFEVPIFSIDIQDDELDEITISETPTKIDKADTAYVIYTSGTTGKPKGVMVSHENLVDYYVGLNEALDVSRFQNFGLMSSLSADLGNTVVYGSLLSGGTLHTFTKSSLMDAETLKSYVIEKAIDCIKIVPSHWKALSNENSLLLPKGMIVFGGEVLSLDILEKIKASGSEVEIVNHYGPTETTIGKLIHKVSLDKNYSRVPIGKTFSATSVYVVNEAMTLCPQGVSGELLIGGLGVSKGYINNAELTAAQFIPNVFEEGNGFLYKTGDKVQLNTEGEIIFIGRVDDQVKIRGYRVEPSEISLAISEHKYVQQSHVSVKLDQNGNNKLVGYIVSEGEFDEELLKGYLQSRLPDYMIPTVFMELAQMPLTSNGKVDRKALPEPETFETSQEYEAPRNKVEEDLCEIWSSLLNVEKVGINDDFFALGGHSLLAIRLISEIKTQKAMEVSIADLFEYPTVATLAMHIESNKEENKTFEITPQERPERIPLSFAQERLWFIDNWKGSTPYHQPSLFRINGNINTATLIHTFKKIIDRHEALRTVFLNEEGKPYQSIKTANDWSLNQITINEIGDTSAALNEYLEDAVYKAFDLAIDYMLRVTLITISENEHLLLTVRHHIASDGWSLSLLINEFVEIYQAKSQNVEPVLPELSIQYADYTIWHRNHIVGEAFDQKMEYWENKLKGLEVLDLSTDFNRPAIQSTRGDYKNFTIGKEQTTALKKIAQEEGTTLYMVLITAYKTLFYQYTNQTDICIGTTVSNRKSKELEPLIGFFVNTLALRTEFDKETTFKSLLKEVRKTVVEAYDHVAIPFEKVVDKIEVTRDSSRTSLFQHLFVFNNNPDPEIQLIDDISLTEETLTMGDQIAKFDITFFVQEINDELSVSINYCIDLFTESRMIQMGNHFSQLLENIITNKDSVLADIEYLSVEEKETLLALHTNEATFETSNTTILDLFEAQVEANPNTIAHVFGATEYTYAALSDKATRLGQYLKENYEVGANDMVGVMMDTNEWSMICMLGILKSGAGYVFIDNELPEDRKGYIIQNAAIKALIIMSDDLFEVTSFEVPIFSIDIQDDELDEITISETPTKIDKADTAYVIYTSGTTGKPKGVMVSHENLVDYYVGLNEVLDINRFQNFGLMSSLSADLGNTVVYGSLLSGGTLHTFTKSSLMDAETLKSYVTEKAIDCIKIVPSHWKALSNEDSLLLPKGMIVFGGEVLSLDILEKIKASGSEVEIVNHYGPTETTIGKLIHKVSLDKNYSRVPIGKTFSATSVYVVNEAMTLCPQGVSGELLIGGLGVSKGYINNAELTAAQFIPNVFEEGNGFLYKTGDKVQLNTEGEIIFIGRVDDQVKIRGYRVEPSEISLAISEHKYVQQSHVSVKLDQNGNNKLVGYIVSEGEFDEELLKGYLQSRLPDYMIPTVFMELAQMPLTSNGKVDRKALPEPETFEASQEYEAPRNKVEEDLCEIWSSLLNVEKVGINDGFFELGGDSIIVIQFVSRAKRKGHQFKVQDLFDHQTIAELSELLETRATEKHVAEQGILEGKLPLTPIQEWFFEEESGHKTHFNMNLLFKIDKKINETNIKMLAARILEQHDALRLQFENVDGVWEQAYGNDQGICDFHDISEVETTELAQKITEICENVQRSNDLIQGKLAHFTLINTPESESHNRLFLSFHHLGVDGVSIRIILDEMELILDAFLQNVDVELGPKTNSYREWAVALQEFANSTKITEQKEYWETVKNAFVPFATDHSDEVQKRASIQSVIVNIDETLTTKLTKSTNNAYNTEINDILLTVLAKTMTNWTQNEHVVIGLEGHGREAIEETLDISNTVGWFTNKYPLLLTVNTEETGDLIKSVKEQIRNVPDKGLGFGCLKYLNAKLGTKETLAGTSWDVGFNYLGQMDNVINQSNWFLGATENTGNHISEHYPIREKIVVKGAIMNNKLGISWDYSDQQYYKETIQYIANQFIINITQVIEHCEGKEDGDFTPSDFDLQDKVSISELDTLFESENSEADGIIKF